MRKIQALIFLCSAISIFSGCQGDDLVQSPELKASVSSLLLEPSGPDNSSVDVVILIEATRSWYAGARNPLAPEEPIDWIRISEVEAECPSNTYFKKSVTLTAEPNASSQSRVCELVFHAVGGEVIIPVKQKGGSL